MAQSNNGSNTPDYSGIGIMSEEDQRFYREITENTFESKQARIAMIRNSGKSILEQIKELSYDPYSQRDIVAYILQNGPHIIHFLKPSTLLDEQGNDLRDFVESDDHLYFQEIIKLLTELEKPQYADVVKNNAAYIRSVKRATEVWGDILEMQQEAGGTLWCGDDEPGTVFLDEDEDCGVEGCVFAYNLVKDFILSCARWELEKTASQDNLVKIHMRGVVEKYIKEQKELLHSYFQTYMRDVNKLIPLVDWDGSGTSVSPQAAPIQNAPQVPPNGKSDDFVIEEDGMDTIGYNDHKKHIILKKYNGQDPHVTIPDGVEKIGDEAFCDCAFIQSVEIPESVKMIGDSAFLGCTGLTRLNLSKVEKIGNSAFRGCTGLTELNIPIGVDSIRHDAFRDCTGLENVTIQTRTYRKLRGSKFIAGLKFLEKGAFWGCTGLKTVTMPRKGVMFIGFHEVAKKFNLREIFGRGYKQISFTLTKDQRWRPQNPSAQLQT